MITVSRPKLNPVKVFLKDEHGMYVVKSGDVVALTDSRETATDFASCPVLEFDDLRQGIEDGIKTNLNLEYLHY